MTLLLFARFAIKTTTKKDILDKIEKENVNKTPHFSKVTSQVNEINIGVRFHYNEIIDKAKTRVGRGERGVNKSQYSKVVLK